MKILIAVDDDAHTARLLDWIGRHPAWFSPEHDYTVLHCVPAVPPGAANMLNRRDLDSYYDEQAQKAFQPVRAALEAQGLKATYVHKAGSAGDQIAQAADKGGFELLVLGSHGHGAFTKLVVGSTATKAMSQCSTPVLLVR